MVSTIFAAIWLLWAGQVGVNSIGGPEMSQAAVEKLERAYRREIWDYISVRSSMQPTVAAVSVPARGV